LGAKQQLRLRRTFKTKLIQNGGTEAMFRNRMKKRKELEMDLMSYKLERDQG